MINGLKALATLALILLTPLTARASEPPAFEVLEDALALQAVLPAYKGELPGWPDW